MAAVFLSASVPAIGRGRYHETANPFLIQWAVRELVTAVVGRRTIVWGGHPAITPMVWTICEDLGVRYADSVVLYQSTYFEEDFPAENRHFGNVVLVDAVPGDREASLERLRTQMLSREDLAAAVFIGGMEGVEAEFELFRRLHPRGTVLPVASPGGAARELAQRLGMLARGGVRDIDFARFFRTELDLEREGDG